MIDVLSAIVLIIVGMMISKLFRAVFPSRAMLLASRQKAIQKRLYVVSRRTDGLTMLLDKVSVGLGMLTQEQADEYRDYITRVKKRQLELTKLLLED